MTDDRLRTLERRFRETGSVEDETAWLKERVRAGELNEEQLEVAAHCGVPAAARVLSLSEESEATSELEWLRRLDSLSHVAAVRGLLALTKELLPGWDQRVDAKSQRLTGLLVQKLESWCREPSEARGKSIVRLGSHAEVVFSHAWLDTGERPPVEARTVSVVLNCLAKAVARRDWITNPFRFATADGPVGMTVQLVPPSKAKEIVAGAAISWALTSVADVSRST